MSSLSPVVAFWNWWVAGLADVAAMRQRSRVPWQAMILRHGDGFEVHMRQGKGSRVIGIIDPSVEPADPRALAGEMSRNGISRNATVLRLAPNEVFHTDVTLPSAVRDVIENVLRNQLERLSPWRPSEAQFGYQIAAQDHDQLQVNLWVMSSARLTEILSELAAHHINPGVIDCGETVEREPMFNLRDDGVISADHKQRAIHHVLIAVVGIAAIAGATLGWSAYDAYSRRNSLRDRIAQLEASARAHARPDLLRARKRREAILRARSSAPTQSTMLEELSRALPDQAYLDRLEVRDRVVTLHGFASDVPAVVSALENSKIFADVKFVAPITRDKESSRFKFSISASVKPQQQTPKRRQG